MPDKSEWRDRLNELLGNRTEASGLIVALSFGAFTILTLFENTRTLSWAWWVLSFAYLFVFIGVLLMFPHWVNSVREIEYVRRRLIREEKVFPPWYSEADKEKSLQSDSKETGFFGRHFNSITRSIIIVTGILLWIALAFHCGFGNEALLNPACS